MIDRATRVKGYRESIVTVMRMGLAEVDAQERVLANALAAAETAGDADYRTLFEAERQIRSVPTEQISELLPLYDHASQQAEAITGAADVCILRCWGMAFARMDDRRSAVRKYEAGAEADPKDHHVLCNWALALAHLGDRDQAADKCAAAFGLAPNDTWTYLITARRVFCVDADSQKLDWARVRSATLRHPSTMRRFFLYAAHACELSPLVEWESLLSELPKDVDRLAIEGESGHVIVGPFAHYPLGTRKLEAQKASPAGAAPPRFAEPERAPDEEQALCDRIERFRRPTLDLSKALTAFYDAFEAQAPQLATSCTAAREHIRLPEDRPFDEIGPFELREIYLRLYGSAMGALIGQARWHLFTDEAEAAMVNLQRVLVSVVPALKGAP